jgi:hypothetical protein
LAVATVILMPAVPTMHEHVHEHARERQHPERCSEHMGAVFGKQEKASDRQEPHEDKSGPRRQEAALRLVLIFVVMHGHETLPLDDMAAAAV